MSERREEIEARLRELHSEMNHGQGIGDWRMSRAFENLVSNVAKSTTTEEIIEAFQIMNEDLKTVSKNRQNARNEINRLEEELGYLTPEDE